MDVDFEHEHLAYSLRAAALSSPPTSPPPPPPCNIHRLPAELLNAIFTYTLPSVPSFRAIDSPLVLTHVCHPWRALALSQSNLWDTLYLPSPLDGLSDGIVHLCAFWIARSRNRPLSVDFHLASDYQPWKIPQDHLRQVQRVVALLAPHAPRIAKLLRLFPRFLIDDDDNGLGPGLRLQDMVLLDDLFLCDAADPAVGRTRLASRALTAPPRLRCLSLRQTFFDVRAFAQLGRSIAHLDLWQLQGDGQMSIASALQLLRDLPWLESCTLDVAHGDPPALAGAIGTLRLSQLTFLFISWDWLVDVGPILDALHTPSLRRLGLRGPPPTRRAWPHLRRFLRRCSPPLTQLSIKEVGFTDIQLLECLRLTPRLTNLSLSHCSVDSAFIRALRLEPQQVMMTTGLLTPLPTPLPTPPALARDEAEFMGMPMVVDSPTPAPAGNILPMLEFLSLEACDDFDVKDLVAMLHTRGSRRSSRTAKGDGANEGEGGAPPRLLRGIRLSFCRRVQENHRVELERSGVENVVIRVNRAARTRREPSAAAVTATATATVGR